MDYKEKYEMALEGIQEILGSGEDSIKMSRLQLRLQGIFPELKESVDERVRNKLIEFFKGYSPDEEWWGNITQEDILAWLEKQGKKKTEVKYVYTKFQIGDVIVEIKPNGYCQPVRVKYVGEESYYCKSDDEKRFLSFPIISQDEYELVKQVSAWSEEDERMLQGIWDEILANKHDAKECEWKTYDKFLDWLKSLKERCNWKPSDEQMDALHYVTNFDYGGHKATLVSLYEQLMKLKG